jgi:hypothetical protein
MSNRGVRFRRLSSIFLLVTAVLSAQPRNTLAQESGRASQSTDGSRDGSTSVTNPCGSDRTLLKKQQPQSDPQDQKTQPLPTEESASISGIVQDVTGAAVAGAEVSLFDANGLQRSRVTSGDNGVFTFSQIPPGSYCVTVNAQDLEPFQSAEIAVRAREAYEIPGILLRVARSNIEVTVRPTEVVAAEQIRAEERQLVFGVLPNFYTSYIYDAAPLTKRQKYSLVFHEAFDPFGFVGTGISAGIEQANNRFPGYGQGAEGYGKRYAAAFGDDLIGTYLSRAVLPSLFHQDPRYFYQGSGSAKSRLLHALSFAVILRGDNGRPTPNYSFLIGDIGSGLLSNLYYPHADRGLGLVFTNASIDIAARAGGTVIREFLLRRITKNAAGNGKP